MKKKTQAELEQEMAALQYTNPMLLEVRHRPPPHPPRWSRGPPAGPTGTSGVHSDHSLFLLAFPANEDGSDEPDELRRGRGPPSGAGPALLLLCCCGARGPRSSRSAGVFSKHATSTDVQQHGSPHGPWEYATSVHGPRADGAPLRAPTGYDGTTRHAGTSRYAETFWPSPEHGSSRTSRHGPQGDAGPPASARDRSQRSTGASTSGGHDGPSGEHDSTRSRWDDGAPQQDTRQHAK